MHIGRHDCNLNDGNDQHNADHGEEAEDIIVAALVLPQTSEYEQQLDEDDSERNEAGEEDAVYVLGVPGLSWDLARDSVCLCRMLPRLAPVISIPASSVNEWQLDQ